MRAYLSLVVPVVLAAVLALTAAASAAQPKTGEYSYSHSYAGGNAIDRIDFVVTAGEPLKVKQCTWTGYTCGTLTINKALRISKKGKFRYSGPAKSAGTAVLQIAVTGKFTSKSKASVTISSVDDCGEVGPAIVKRDT